MTTLETLELELKFVEAPLESIRTSQSQATLSLWSSSVKKVIEKKVVELWRIGLFHKISTQIKLVINLWSALGRENHTQQFPPPDLLEDKLELLQGFYISLAFFVPLTVSDEVIPTWVVLVYSVRGGSYTPGKIGVAAGKRLSAYMISAEALLLLITSVESFHA